MYYGQPHPRRCAQILGRLSYQNSHTRSGIWGGSEIRQPSDQLYMALCASWPSSRLNAGFEPILAGPCCSPRGGGQPSLGSGVSDSTSSMLVSPAMIFSAPAWRSGRIPVPRIAN